MVLDRKGTIQSVIRGANNGEEGGDGDEAKHVACEFDGSTAGWPNIFWKSHFLKL